MRDRDRETETERERDVKKAFGSVDRTSLFLTLVKSRLSDPCLNTFKATYWSSVHVHKKLFDCPLGVKQGCFLNPALFSLFANEVVTGMGAVGKHGIQLQPGLVKLFLLLFNDNNNNSGHFYSTLS